MRQRRGLAPLLVAAALATLIGCGSGDSRFATTTTASSTATEQTTAAMPSGMAAPTTTSPTPTPTPTTTTSPTSTSTSTTMPTTAPSTPPTSVAADASSYPHAAEALWFLALDNVAASISVHREGSEPWSAAVGRRVDGRVVTGGTPFVVASVSKLVTMLSIARLVEQGDLTVVDPVPWSAMGLAHDPAWDGVTVRELLDHTSGMPINRKSWLDDPGPCSVPLTEALAEPPTEGRGRWVYSNGNYCALGLLVEHATGLALDDAAYALVFDPAGVAGPYLTTDGLRDDSAPSPRGIARLARLGGAGTWMMSTDDLAAMLADVTDADLEVLRWPGIILDQYGWGHTGTVDGAKACAWVIEDGRTTVAAVVSGPEPATGGDVCDAVVPALALDLGRYAGEPRRDPV